MRFVNLLPGLHSHLTDITPDDANQGLWRRHEAREG